MKNKKDKKNIKNFINYVSQETKKAGIKFVLAKKKYLVIPEEGYIRCTGFFDENSSLLKCATNRPTILWLGVLVHEYSHFEQWQKGLKIWEDVIINDKDVGTEISLWIKGKNLAQEKINDYIRRTRNLELDCERRTVKNIKKFKLPINIKDYIQGANAYIYFYNYVCLHRTWYKNTPPGETEEIVSTMPKNFNNRYNVLPKKYEVLYNKFLN